MRTATGMRVARLGSMSRAMMPPTAPPRCPLMEMPGTSSEYATFTPMTAHMPLPYSRRNARSSRQNTPSSATARNRPNALVDAPADTTSTSPVNRAVRYDATLPVIPATR